jgi:hypothetical protein
MRSTRLACVLLLVIAAVAGAQVPRTINFQGRVRDAAGVYLDGQRQCTLRIYDQPTGGTPLFTEVYDADFDKGTFTIRIGAKTPGGIPEEVDFSQQYWLGCTIAGFNGGQEITPRMTMSAAPYSLHATKAVDALYAESAGTLGAPARIVGTSSGTEPILEVVNSDGPIGMIVHGNAYAVVSQGVDSTNRHYVAAEAAGSNAPAPGGFYRDNAPMAWALVNTDGTIISGFGISRVAHGTTGSYTVTLANDAEIDATSKYPMLAPMVQATGLGTAPVPTSVGWFFRATNAHDIIIRMQNAQGLGEDSPFSIIVFGRPK